MFIYLIVCVLYVNIHINKSHKYERERGHGSGLERRKSREKGNNSILIFTIFSKLKIKEKIYNKQFSLPNSTYKSIKVNLYHLILALDFKLTFKN